ncbi:MAG: DNA-binding response regulator [Nitrospirota bacterium]|nr:DNA-binding response regulator [Nitrospirota bacterium]
MKKILIFDESGFSHICSAILELEGHKTEILKDVKDMLPKLKNKEFALIITSYPFGYFLFEEIKKLDLPIIILTDHINRDFISLLQDFGNSYSMIKPLDYKKFRSLVKNLLDRKSDIMDGHRIY